MLVTNGFDALFILSAYPDAAVGASPEVVGFGVGKTVAVHDVRGLP